jgi:protein TonB
MPGPSGPSPQQNFGSLQGCLVEGDPEQRARERRIRRRALAISVALQSVALVLVILVPLFGKTERITTTFIPIPPYYHNAGPTHPTSGTRPQPYHGHFFNRAPFSQPAYIPGHVYEGPVDAAPEPPGFASGPGPDQPCSGCISMNEGRPQPKRPAENRPQPPKRVVMTHLAPAMLIHRVEPVYPPLAVQIHREGRVELRAIIATDGTIQSLQAVSGDPLFYQSALDAVRQWRYRPTILNDQPVEIDTYITVIYTMNH